MEAPIPGVSIGSTRWMMMVMVVEVFVREMLGTMGCLFCLAECRSSPPAVTSAEVVVVGEREERSALTARTLLSARVSLASE
jgi:hypothetical protein